MLVLSRKPGEKIVVNDGELIVEILAVQGNKVRVGITGDAEKYKVVRGENFTPGDDSHASAQRPAG